MAKEPLNPKAGVSGPREHSKRTDLLRMGSTSYGEGIETSTLRKGAPLAKTPDVNPISRSEQGIAPSQLERLTPLYAPTQRPDEPVTTGIALGAGAGPEVLGVQSRDDAEYVSAYQLFQNLASKPDASPSLQYLAQRIQQGF